MLAAGGVCVKPRSGAAVVAPPGSSPHEHPGPGWHQTLLLAVFLPPAQAEEAVVATSCSAWAALCSVKRGQSFSGSSPGAHQGLPNSALRPRRPAASPRGFASQGGQDVAGRLERRLLALSQGCTRLLAALSRQGGREDPGSLPKNPSRSRRRGRARSRCRCAPARPRAAISVPVSLLLRPETARGETGKSPSSGFVPFIIFSCGFPDPKRRRDGTAGNGDTRGARAAAPHPLPLVPFMVLRLGSAKEISIPSLGLMLGAGPEPGFSF